MRNPRPSVFLDRDGVINRKMPSGRYVTRPEELILLPGAAEAIGALKRAGCRVIVVTNQRGVARGLMTLEDLERIHALLRQQIVATTGQDLDAIYACPHEEGACDCRKPQVGMFLQAQRDFPDIDFSRSVLVSDSLKDLEAGARLGCSNVLVIPEEEKKQFPHPAWPAHLPIHALISSLQAGVPQLLSLLSCASKSRTP